MVDLTSYCGMTIHLIPTITLLNRMKDFMYSGFRFKFFTSFVFPDDMNRNINLFRHNLSILSSIFLRTPPICFREDVFL